MNERIKKLRKALNLTQQNFANKLGITQNAVAKYETDRITPSNAIISLICTRFNINETWLRTGEGEMYQPNDNNIILNDATLDDADRAILLAYINAPPEIRAYIKQLVLDTADKIRTTAPTSAPPITKPEPRHTDTPEEAALRAQKHAELDAKLTEDFEEVRRDVAQEQAALSDVG